MALLSFKGLPGFPSSSGQEMVGFDLNDEYLKIAHVRVSSLKREVVNLAHREVRGLSEDEIASFIRQTLTQFKLKSARAFLTAPLYLVITRTIEIPSKDPEEIKELVNLQASRHTHYARSEIIIDMMALGVVRESYTKVLLVIVPKDAVSRQIQILDKAGLKLEKVLFPPEGICAASSKILGSEPTDSTIAVVHMDSVFTSFIVTQKGKVLFVRGIPIGANHLLDEKEIYSDRFVDELQKSLEAYTNDEMGHLPAALFLTGVAAETKDLDNLFSETLRIPIKHQTYFNHFAISSEARSVAVSASRVSFFNLIAPLLLFDKMKIDLNSDEKKLKIQLEERGREVVKTGMLVMMILALVFLSFVGKVYTKKAFLQNLVSRYRLLREEAKSLERTFTRTRLVKDTVSNRGRSIETLAELYDTLPQDVRLGLIKYEEGSTFTVKGTSATMASVFSFVTNLEKSPRFKGVKTKYVTTRNENGQDVADFEINCQLERPGEAA